MSVFTVERTICCPHCDSEQLVVINMNGNDWNGDSFSKDTNEICSDCDKKFTIDVSSSFDFDAYQE